MFIGISLLLTTQLFGQALSKEKVMHFENELSDVMELIGNDIVKLKLDEVKAAYEKKPTELNNLRLGIIYHEVALNLTFFTKTGEYDGYAQRSYDRLTKILADKNTPEELKIFASSYQASALALVSGEKRKLKLLSEAFNLFKTSVEKYSSVSPRPEFMRGSVAENLPWFMWSKRKYAKKDFNSIIEKSNLDSTYADFRLLSFSYWGWARAHNKRKHRKKAIEYLKKAIEIDPNYSAGRKRSEELLNEYQG